MARSNKRSFKGKAKRKLRLEPLAKRELMAGDLDNGFGYGLGFVHQDIDDTDDQATAVAVSNNGKVVVGGYTDFGGGGSNFALMQYNSNGTLDTNFGGVNGAPDGMVVTDFSGTHQYAAKIAIQDDGKIIAMCSRTTPWIETEVFLARYNADGTLDNTFGDGGQLQLNFDLASEYGVQDVFIEQNKIVVAAGRLLLRLNMNGTIDTGFGNNGQVDVYNIVGQDMVDVEMHDGKILVSTSSYVGNDTGKTARFLFNGSLDASYATNGIKDLPEGISLHQIAVDGSGRWLGFNHHVVVRLTADGELDNTFQINGVMESEDVPIDVHCIVTLPGGLIGLVGMDGDELGVSRLDSFGNIDANFGANGVASHDLLGAHSIYARDAMGLANNDILIVGRMQDVSVASNDFFVAKIDGSSQVQIPLGGGGLKAPSNPTHHRPVDSLVGVPIAPGPSRATSIKTSQVQPGPSNPQIPLGWREVNLEDSSTSLDIRAVDELHSEIGLLWLV